MDVKKISEVAWRIYDKIKHKLEREHFGDYLIIDVETGEHFLGKTKLEAFKKARERKPKAILHLIKVGFKAAHKIKSRR